MKSLCLGLLTIMILITGCASTMFVKHDQSSYNEIYWNFKSKNVKSKKYDGQVIKGKLGIITSDVIHIGNRRINTNDIIEISSTDHGKGAVKGLGYGSLIGATTGFLLGYTSFEGSGSNIIGPRTATGAGFMGAVLLTPAGGLLGLLFGALAGDKETYVFTDPIQQILPAEKLLATDENNKLLRVSISSVVEKGIDHITIMYRGKEIYLARSDYKYRGISDNGESYIVVTKEIYNRKFE